MRMSGSLLVSFLVTAPVAAQRLLTWDTATNAVYQLDVATGAPTFLGTVTTNVGVIGGAAYDRLAGRIYLSSTSLDSLFFVDITNGVATLVGGYGIGTAVVMHGLEWDASTNTLYGMSSHDNGLYTIDRTTGLATLVGPTGLAPSPNRFCNLVHHAAANVMFMTDTLTASTYTIDRATGAATLVGPLNVCTWPQSLAFDSDNGLLYVIDSMADTLYTIAPSSGAATVVGTIGPSNCLGLAYIPGAGRLTRTFASCGPTTITVTGHPAPGGTITTTLGNVVGFPLHGLGVTQLGLSFCGCPIGHEWAVALLGANLSLPIPPNPTIVGAQVFIQGIDFLAPGGCADPQHTMTDTITVTIG
jgi:DNA-binding beta-propeller fold protein YncE